MLHRGFRWLLVCFFLFIPIAIHPQGNAEIVRGRIVDTEQKPVADATVTVTGSGSQLVRTTHTDQDGRFTTLFLEGDGSYTVLVRKIGYSPSIKRVSRSGLSNVVAADAVLARSAYALDPLTSNVVRLGGAAKLDKPSIGGIEQDMLSATQFLLDQSDLDALIRLTPGLFATGDSGYSVMGASSEQNSKLLDGMKFDGASLPPDAVCGVGVATSTSNPSRGGFAGGQTSVQTCRGRDYFASSLRASLVDPALTWSDAASPNSPARIGTWSGFVSGAFRAGVAHYRLSASGSARATDSPSLLAPRAALLPQLGLSVDTVATLGSTLNALHVPLSVAGIPSSAQNHNGVAVLSIDWNPGAATAFLLTAVGSLSGSDAGGLNESVFPSSLNSSSQRSGRMQVRGSTYLHGFVDDLTTAITASTSQTTPYLALPAGNVRVGTEYDDGQTSLTSLRFGGGSNASHQANEEWNTKNQISWISKNGLHQLSIGQEAILDWNSSLQAFNTLGTYSYQTLADLTANEPSSFTRTLDATERSNHYATGALWLFDTWRATKQISFEGGLRADVATFATTPDYNPAVDAIFGRRTDQVPTDFGLSPRLGFAWLIKHRPVRTYIDKATGQERRIGYFEESDLPTSLVPRGNVGAGITFFGNLGAYRGVIPPGRVAALVDRTGLPGTTRTLTCVGDATPIPDWSTSTGALADSCLGGAAPVFSANQPTVSLIDPSMRAPVDWKLNLGLTGLYWAGAGDASINVLMLREQNTESQVDLNLRRTIGFNLAAEANRPVYVTSDQIVASSGAIAPNANRISDQYGAVTNAVSDLHRTAAQVNIVITPPFLFRKLWLRFAYSYNAQSNEYRGFGGSTAGDPFAIESAAGAQPTHQLTISTPRLPRLWWFDTGLRTVISSGTAYTPMVVGDINGDGLSNDRAFVANPAVTADTALASQMRTLLAAAPASARSCLQAQLGQIAATNSCRGPWQVRLDLRIDFSPPQGVGLGDRLHFTTNLVNAGGALMRVLGVNSAVTQGSLPPDGRLLYVTGFDATTQRFRYAVNQTFGQPLNFGVGNHGFPPFQLQIGAEYKFGVAPNNPNLRNYGLAPTKTSLPNEADVRSAFARFIRSPGDTIVALRDSLGLSADQVAKLRALNAAYQPKADSVMAAAVKFVLQRGAKFTDGDLFTQFNRFNVFDPIRSELRDKAMAVLSDAQAAKFQAILTASRMRLLQ